MRTILTADEREEFLDLLSREAELHLKKDSLNAVDAARLRYLRKKKSEDDDDGSDFSTKEDNIVIFTMGGHRFGTDEEQAAHNAKEAAEAAERREKYRQSQVCREIEELLLAYDAREVARKEKIDKKKRDEECKRRNRNDVGL